MKTIQEYEGENIVIRSPSLHETQPVSVRLHKVEEVGIWIESQQIINQFLAIAGVSMSPKTSVIFVPWSHVAWILGSLDVPAISDSSAS